MIRNSLLFKHFTSNTQKTEGLFTYLQRKEKSVIDLSSSQPISNLNAILDIDSTSYAAQTNLSVPLYIDFNLNNFYVVVSSYMLRGVTNLRRMRDFKILGKKSIDPDWTEIDSQNNLIYCGIEQGKEENCGNNETFFVDSPNSLPFNQIRLQLISDGMNLTEDVRFRLMCFEIYGTLLRKVGTQKTFHIWSISSLLFIVLFIES